MSRDKSDRQAMEEWPTNLDMTSLDAVKGQTLEKMCLASETNNERVYYVRKPTTLELQGGCDQCARQHLRNNTTCSMWLKRPSYAKDFGVLYDPVTKQEITGWQLISVDTRRHHRVTKETYIRA